MPRPPLTHTPSTMVLCQKQFSQPTMLGISDTVTQNKLLLGVLVRVTVAGMKYQDQNSVGRKGFILAHTSRRLSIAEALMSGRELREGRTWRRKLIDVEAMEWCCLLAFSSRLAQPAYLQNPGSPA